MGHDQVEPSLEKRELELRFIPIACATPLVYAYTAGFFERNGLQVKLRSAPGWSGIKELLIHDHIDAAHILCPMTLASSLGIDGKPAALRLCAMQNVNGQAFVLAKKYAGLRNVTEMHGFRFGVPYRFSMHYYLLCALLAKHGLNPQTDVIIEEVVPPRMPNYLRTARLDGVFAPEPFGELLVEGGDGVLFASSRDVWPGHPCCGLGVTQAFFDAHPNTCLVLARSLMEAQWALRHKHGAARAAIADEIAPVTGWNIATVAAMRRVLERTTVHDPGDSTCAALAHIDFVPHAFHAYGQWIVAQMQRTGQLRQPVDSTSAVAAVFNEEETTRLATSVGFPPMTPSLEGMALEAGLAPVVAPEKLTPPDAMAEMRYEMSESTQKRVGDVLRWLALLVGGEPVAPLPVTSGDSIGWLERMLGEAALNVRFNVEALAERMEMLERARQQEALVEAQQSLIHELSAPIMPVLDRVLVVPLVGAFDDLRAGRVTQVLLDRISKSDTEVVLLDVTGVPTIDANGIEQWLRLTQAVALLGAECVIVGVTANVAMGILAHAPDAKLPRTCADLQSGLEYALRQTGRRIASVVRR